MPLTSSDPDDPVGIRGVIDPSPSSGARNPSTLTSSGGGRPPRTGSGLHPERDPPADHEDGALRRRGRAASPRGVRLRRRGSDRTRAPRARRRTCPRAAAGRYGSAAALPADVSRSRRARRTAGRGSRRSAPVAHRAAGAARGRGRCKSPPPRPRRPRRPRVANANRAWATGRRETLGALRLLDHVPSVDDEGSGPSVARALRREERDQLTDLLRRPRATDRRVTAPPRAPSAVCEPVAIHPGSTLFTVTPLRATSIARPRISPSMPAFAAA